MLVKIVARPERFELPAFWFVGRSAKTSKCRYWYRLRATRAMIWRTTGFTHARRTTAGPHVRHVLGGIAVPAEIAFPDTLQKTRSGKIMRRLLKARNWAAMWEIFRHWKSRRSLLG